MERIIIQLDAELLEELDRAADRDGVSRSAEVRQAIRWSLAEKRRREELRAVVEALGSLPPEDLTLPPQRVAAAWPE